MIIFLLNHIIIYSDFIEDACAFIEPQMCVSIWLKFMTNYVRDKTMFCPTVEHGHKAFTITISIL